MNNHRLPLIISAFCILGIGVFAWGRIAPLLRGVPVTVTALYDGMTIRGPITIAGTAPRATRVTINGEETVITKDEGAFTHTLLLPDGYSILSVAAEDKFGNTTTRRFEVVVESTPSTPSLGGPITTHNEL